MQTADTPHVVGMAMETCDTWLELDGVVHVTGPRDSAYTPGGVHHRWRAADGLPYRLIIVKESSA